MTSNAVWQCHSGQEIGSLEPGKLADFVILEQDPRRIDPMMISDIGVSETWMDGKKVFSTYMKRIQLMKRSQINQVVCLVMIILSSGCSGASDSESETISQSSPDSGATDTCTAVETLDASLDKLEDSESMDEYRARYAVVRQDFETLRDSSGGKYAAETTTFESALDEFEASLASLDDGGLLSGLLGIASDAASLAAAGDDLDDAIDCP